MTKTFIKRLINRSMIIKITLLLIPIVIGLTLGIASGCDKGGVSATDCITP